MKAKVIVGVDRDVALDAIRALDALGEALLAHTERLPKKLRRQYKDAREDLVRAVGFRAHFAGVAEQPSAD
jgi:hypothetical protein